MEGAEPSLMKTGFQRIPCHLKLRRRQRRPFLLRSFWKTKTLIRLQVDLYGFIGWNITRNELKNNESQTASDFIQGCNSWTSIQGGQQSREWSCFYGGMTPPDQAHTYELHVCALDGLLDLQTGFYLNELYHKMEGHILDKHTLKGIYDKI